MQKLLALLAEDGTSKSQYTGDRALNCMKKILKNIVNIRKKQTHANNKLLLSTSMNL